MDYKNIILSKEDHIAKVTLNRPRRLNSLNEEVFQELIDAFDNVGRDPEMRVLVITGAGDRAFSSGADLKLPGEGGEQAAYERKPILARDIERTWPQGTIRALRRLEIPTIAAINGVATGGGYDLALACDIRIGSEKARFMVAFARLGVTPIMGGSWTLPRIVGFAKAAELLFTGNFVEAEEAFRIGLLNKLVPHSKLMEETMAMASTIASRPPIGIRMSKMLLYRDQEVSLETALELACMSSAIVQNTEDFDEAILAFREKRQGVVKGK